VKQNSVTLQPERTEIIFPANKISKKFHALTEKDKSVDGEDYDGDEVKSGDGNKFDDSNGDEVDGVNSDKIDDVNGDKVGYSIGDRVDASNGDKFDASNGDKFDASNGDKFDADKAEDAESSKKYPSNSLKQDDEIFFVGQRFSNIAELEAAQARYEGRNFCELWKRDVRTLVAALKRVPKRVANANVSLKYYSVKLCCKFGGKSVKQREDRQRDTKSFKRGCPFEVYLALSSDGATLDVLKISETHNHPLSEDVYRHLPRQRRLTGSLKEEAKNAVRLKANSKLLQQEIQGSTGLPVTLKDIANLKMETNASINSNELDVVVNYLNTKDEAVVEIAIDEENNFKSLLFQDGYMKRAYDKYPELLLVDATYKLLNLRMPVYILMVVDGHGLSEIVGILIVAEESEAVIRSVMESFKRHNEAWTKTNVIMSDKDFTERQVFAKCFPGASLLICLYHTLRTFRREVTVEKMGITSSERNRALEIIRNIVYSKSQDAYEANISLLKDTKWKAVKEYFFDNWHPIKEQWVSCFKDSVFNLGETTNNRLESTNAKIKSVCSAYGSLLQFFTEMSSVLGALRNERKHERVMGASRLPTNVSTYDEDIRAYADVLTPYAFKHLKKQAGMASLVKVEKISSNEVTIASTTHGRLTVTSQSCQCTYPIKMGLPCRHILKTRIILKLSRFDPSLFSTRWTVEYSQEPCEIENEDPSGTTNIDFLPAQKQKRKLTQSEKFRKAMKVAQNLASLASEGGMKVFKARLAEMQQLADSWQIRNTFEHDKKSTMEENSTDVPVVKRDHGPPKSTPEMEPTPDKLSDQNGGELHLPVDTATSSTEKSPDLKTVKIPQKMRKRGRPKGAETTVIGLPKAKKVKKGLVPFSKLRAVEKDRVLLECLVRPFVASKAISDGKLVHEESVKNNIHDIPDMIRDNENVDLSRIDKYFTARAWSAVLKISEKKEHSKWICPGCSKSIKSEDSIACERCLGWYHTKCTSMKKGQPKLKNWFCKICKNKYL
jgi:zinc finger SWIM domain-containing protein 3